MKTASGARVWFFVIGVFACLATAYVFAFRAANATQIRDVPLATQGAKP